MQTARYSATQDGGLFKQNYADAAQFNRNRSYRGQPDVTVWLAMSHSRRRAALSDVVSSAREQLGWSKAPSHVSDNRQVPPSMDHGPVTQQPVERSAAAPAMAETPGASHRAPRKAKLPVPASWPLLAVLAVQAVLSLRLVGADTAFEDEAEYLWAGHLEWAHILHGSPLPQFPAYFSGAPVIYPPLGALADSAGGLAGARILSLVFMLGATTALWATAKRLFGRRAAFFAAALFAVLGPTLHLGSFATYDALSLFLVALAAWLVVRAGQRQDATGWMIAAGAALALANAVCVYVGFVRRRRAPARPGYRLPEARRQARGRAPPDGSGRRRGAPHAGAAASAEAAMSTESSRQRCSGPAAAIPRCPCWPMPGRGPASSSLPLSAGWSSAGPAGEGGARTWLLALLAGAALVVPLDQAIIHTTASLTKHVDTGAWFAAIAAGYAVDKLIAAAAAGNTRAITCGAFVIALVFPVSLGAGQSRGVRYRPGLTRRRSPRSCARWRTTPRGACWSRTRLIAEYYLPAGSQWMRWSSTRNIVTAFRVANRRPERCGRRCRPGQRRHLRPVYRRQLLFCRRAELRRYDISGPQHRGRPQPQPPLPQDPGRTVRLWPSRPGPGRHT